MSLLKKCIKLTHHTNILLKKLINTSRKRILEINHTCPHTCSPPTHTISHFRREQTQCDFSKSKQKAASTKVDYSRYNAFCLISAASCFRARLQTIYNIKIKEKKYKTSMVLKTRHSLVIT